ncbi:hypothetical protein L7F22_026724 [Adiantum nelumboides]|nr:hypothetical protein [Adiantum nelumboides]
MTNTDVPAVLEEDYIAQHHHHETLERQASSVLSKRIRAPVDVVWSTVRKFDEPQKYKTFVKSCIMHGDVRPGNVREVCVISGLPATTSLEMLEMLDDEQHIICYRVLGGDHRLRNYKSMVTLHPETVNGKPGTLVLESFSVDIPDGNTKDDAKFFVEALIKCNLKALADICEKVHTG